MKSEGLIRLGVVFLIVFGFIPLIAGCGDKKTTAPPVDNPPPATTGNIAGTVSLPPGMSGDLSNSRVAVFANYDDWNADRVMRQQAVQGSGATISFIITGLPAGTYYLDVWKDIDNDGLFDAGDFYGVNGTIQWPTVTPAPIAVIVGQTSSASVLIYSVP